MTIEVSEKESTAGHEVEKDVPKSGGGKERIMNQVLKTKHESSSCRHRIYDDLNLTEKKYRFHFGTNGV